MKIKSLTLISPSNQFNFIQMAKKNDQSRAAAKKRMDKLEKALFDAVHKALKPADGDFTVHEVVATFTKLAHNYNNRGLDFQYNEAEPPAAEGVHQMIPEGNA